MKNEILERYEKWGFPQKENLNLPYSIRCNSHLISLNKLKTRLLEKKVKVEKISFLKNGLFVNSSFPLASSIEYLLGYFYIQEAPTQIVGEIVEKIIGGRKYEDIKIIDLCASPGGKITHVADVMRNKGNVVALEKYKKRFETLCYNIERMRVENISALNIDALNFKSEDFFDIVLLDAPCSGNYLQSKDWLLKRKFSDFKNRQELQKKLADKADLILKKKGSLIYSTCSLEIEENEEIVEYILKKGYSLEKLDVEGYPGIKKNTENSLRFWPTQSKLPALFIAHLKKL